MGKGYITSSASAPLGTSIPAFQLPCDNSRLVGNSYLISCRPEGDSRLVWLKEFKDASSRTEIPSDSSKLSALLRRKMPQLARLSVKPGIPKIKRRLRTGKRPLETRLGFRGYTPRVGALIERDDACCFPYFVGKVRYLRGHLRPPHKKT